VTRRVLFCTQTANVRGGLETWIDEFVPFLAERDWQPVFALARGRRFHDPDRYRAAHPLFSDTVEIEGVTREQRVASLQRAIRRTKPDLVVPVNVADAIEAVAREKLRGSNVRLLTMLRAIEPWGELEDVRRFGAFVDIAVGGNRLLARLIEAWSGMQQKRIRYIPTGTRRGLSCSAGFLACAPVEMPPEVATSGSADGGRRLGSLRYTGEQIRLAYIGRLEERDKRVLDLIDVVKRLTVPHTLTIAGDGPARARLEASLDANFLGDVPVDRLYDEVYPNLDAVLIFSTAEAGPQVAYQAMHFGVVPISSRYLGLRAEGALRDGETALLFDVGDTAAAAAQIERLARDPELRARIGAAAQREVDPRYLLDNSFEQYLAAFNDAVTMPRAIGTLPTLAPSGFFERWHLPWLRRFRTTEASEPGGEWPHHGGVDAETVERMERLARELDT